MRLIILAKEPGKVAVRGRPTGKQVLRFAQDDKFIRSRTVTDMRLIILAEESGKVAVRGRPTGKQVLRFAQDDKFIGRIERARSRVPC